MAACRCQTTFGDAHAISIVAMASPEDLQIGAEYIRMADQIIDVPGGPSNNNYGNASLIVETAEQACVDAVWPGWGHASENPDLPLMLSKCTPEIRFLGPPSGALSSSNPSLISSLPVFYPKSFRSRVVSTVSSTSLRDIPLFGLCTVMIR